MPNGVVLADGAVAGHWRREIRTDSIRVEVFLYDEPGPAARGLDAAMARLGRFLRRPVETRTVRLAR